MQEKLKRWWADKMLPAIKATPANLKLFLTTPVVFKNLGMMIAALLLFAVFIVKGLDVYTKHGDSIYLDNLMRKTLKQAKKDARKGDYKVVVFDSIWKQDTKAGLILSQNPLPGSRIKEGRTVYLTVSSATPPKVELPLLKDAAYVYDSYKRILEVRGIKTEIKKEIMDSKQSKGTILYLYHDGKKLEESDLKDGYFVEKGDKVEMVITKQVISQRTVPDLLCMKLSTARFLLESNQLNLDLIEDANVVDLEEAFIFKQTPAPGSTAISGDYIKLYLQLDKPLSCPTETPTLDEEDSPEDFE